MPEPTPVDDAKARIARVREQQKGAQVTPAEAAQAISQVISSGGAIVCYTRCWSWVSDYHYDPPRAHPWADADDIEHAKATGQPEPTSDCACYCAKEPTR